MARRKAKRRSGPKFKGIRVVPAIEALAQATIWSEATMGVNPFEFLTGVTNPEGGYKGGFRPGSDGGQRITLPELLGVGPGGFGGNFGDYAKNLPEAIGKNIGGIEGMVMTGLKSAGLSIGFRVFNKLTRKARGSINRQILKPFGMDSFVRF